MGCKVTKLQLGYRTEHKIPTEGRPTSHLAKLRFGYGTEQHIPMEGVTYWLV